MAPVENFILKTPILDIIICDNCNFYLNLIKIISIL